MKSQPLCEALESRTLLTVLPAGFEETFVTQVPTSVATSMTFAPDGRLFVSDNRTGDVRIVKNGVLLPTPFLHVNVDDFRERGLEGVVLDPNFEQNGYVYIYYTKADPSNPNTAPNNATNQVSRFKASISNPDIADSTFGEQVLLSNIPSTTGYHNGGMLRFGKDGMLYLGVGDSHTGANSQDLSTLAGKILRLDVADYPNIIPSDNPFVHTAGARGEIYELGMRNPYSGDVDPTTGRFFVNDVGESTWEEIDELTAGGGNYGWPTLEGAQNKPGYIDPIFEYLHTTPNAAITGGAFNEGNQFPSTYKGDYFFADYVNHFIHVFNPTTKSASDFATDGYSYVNLDTGPDGSLYALDLTGNIYKYSYVGVANRPPIALPAADKTNGPLTLSVNFDGSASTDPDNDPLTYSWDFGDGTTGTGETIEHDYATAGQFNATLTVSDGNGGSDQSQPIVITAGDTAPVVTISLPTAGSTYAAGDTISFAGDATDAEDPTIPDSAFHWSIVFHHEMHTHPFINAIDGVRSGTFVIPVTGEVDPVQWYRVHLTVTDSQGLASKDTYVDVLPRKSSFTLASNVSGAQLTLDGTPETAGTSTLGVVGMQRAIGAPSSFTLNGKSYQFVSWSDGGAAIHNMLTPPTNATFTATYKDITPASITLTPTADAYVADGGSAAKNFGTATTLQVKTGNSGVNRQTYLMFDLSKISSAAKAVLKLYGGFGVKDSEQIAVYKTSTSWSEKGITYNNRPAATGSALATLSITDGVSTTRQFDLTAFIQSEKAAGHTTAAIVIKAINRIAPIATFTSREGASANRPQLVITPLPGPQILSPTADAYVRGGTSASTNFGAAKTLDIQATASANNQREADLRFDLSSITTITSAKLRLYGKLSDTTATKIVTNVYGSTNTTWSETGLNFNNRPASSGSSLASASILNTTAQWYDFDITAYIKSQKSAGKNLVTLILRNPTSASPYTTFNSREATSNQPQLVVT